MTALTFRTDVFGSPMSFNAVSLNPVSGFTPKQYDLVVKRFLPYENGAAAARAAERSSWVISGATASNTTAVAVAGVPIVGRIYFKSLGTTNYTLEGYLDSAMTASKVIEGSVTRSSGGALTLAEANSSGLTGTVTIAANATNDASGFYVDIKMYHDRYDASVDASASNILGFLYYQDLENDATLKTWSVAETGQIVDFDKLLSLSCADNVTDIFTRNALQNNLRAKGWTS
jgi:hypothetical protein